MTRISSASTSVQKTIGLALCLGFLIGAYVSYTSSAIPCLLFLFAAAAVAVVWWKYVRPASHMFMDKENLYVKRHGSLETISFDRVLRVHRPPLLRNPPLIITYDKGNGVREELTLIPSFVANGGLFGKYKLEETLKEAISRKHQAQARPEA